MERFEHIMPKLQAMAYKMTKSAVDAEDIVHDVYVKYAQKSDENIQNPSAYWMKAVINRCLEFIEKRSKTVYPGPDLPEPIFQARFEKWQAFDVSYAMLLLLQKLNPLERAVFILRETMDYSHGEIAQAMDMTEAQARQLFHRAKEKMAADKIVNKPTRAQCDSLVHVFLSGKMDELLSLLKEDVVIYSDGGGKVSAALQPIMGQKHAFVFLRGLAEKFGAQFSIEIMNSNGQEGIAFRRKNDGLLDSLMHVEFQAGQISAFYIIRNPDKLLGFH